MLATLHAQSASGAIQSMRSLGAHPHLLASTSAVWSLSGWSGRSVPHCLTTFDLSDAPHTFGDVRRWLKDDEGRLLHAASGCPACSMTGFTGRTGVFEVLPATPALRDLVANARPAAEVHAQALADGMLPFRHAALLQVGPRPHDDEEIFPRHPDRATAPQHLTVHGGHVWPRTPCPVPDRPPARAAAVLFMAGIAVHRALPPAPLVYLFAIAVTLAVGWRLLRRPIWCSALLALRDHVVRSHRRPALRVLLPGRARLRLRHRGPRLAQVELYIDNPPRVLTNPFDRRRAMPPKQVTTAPVTRVKTWSGWRDATGDVLVQIAQPHPRLAAGQTVRALGMLQRPAAGDEPGAVRLGGRTTASSASSRRSHVPHADNIQILDEPVPGPLAVAARAKPRGCSPAGFPAERSLDHALLRGAPARRPRPAAPRRAGAVPAHRHQPPPVDQRHARRGARRVRLLDLPAAAACSPRAGRS